MGEILEAGSFGALQRERQTAVYRVRFGVYETEMYLERAEVKGTAEGRQSLCWWSMHLIHENNAL